MDIKSYVKGVVLLAIVQYCWYSVSGSLDHSASNCSLIWNDQTTCNDSADVLVCPAREPKINITTKLDEVLIECFTMDNEAYLQLPLKNISKIKKVEFKECPLPASGCSIQAILDRLGINNFKELSLNSHSTLTRQHLQGLSNIEQLNIIGTTDLAEDLFNDTGNLTWFILRSKNVHLPLNIFRNLEKLIHLDLGMNNLKNLKRGCFSHQKLLKYLFLNNNDLQNLNKDVFYGLSSMSHLDLSSNKLVTLDSDVFSLLENMRELNLNENYFKSLSIGLLNETKKLERFQLMNNYVELSILPAELFANSPQLRIVNLECGLKNISSNFFQGLYHIEYASLANNHLETLPSTLFQDMEAVSFINLKHNKLKHLDDGLFERTNKLEKLWLSHNQLEQISAALFLHLKAITEINISNNRLHTIHNDAFISTRRLNRLMLENNKLSFNNEEFAVPFKYLKKLQTLILRNNSMVSILDNQNINVDLKELDLSYNKISSLSLSEILFHSSNIIINLTSNSIQKISFNEINDKYADLGKKQIRESIYLGNNPLLCDCDILDFIQVLNNTTAANPLTINITGLKCSGPDRLAGRLASDITPQELWCQLDLSNECPRNCSCFKRPFDKSLIVNCSNANLNELPYLPFPIKFNLTFSELFIENNQLTALPSIHNHSDGYAMVREIHARNNSIKELTSKNIPSNLRILDLMQNKLQFLDKGVLNTLNGTSTLQHLTLSDNPWQCNCLARDFLLFTQVHRNIIDNITLIECEDGISLAAKETANLCPEDRTLFIVVAVVLVLLSISAVITAMYYKYQQEIRVWLFAHNLLSWLVNEQEVDQNLEYDAFISYSHLDVKMVMDSIVSVLENDKPPFKLCLHERNWKVGNPITQSIAESVFNSRRTIIVLTRNFIKSDWARTEFQVAHRSAMNENRARVIIIVCCDLKDIEFKDPELQSYLKTNTYITLSDKWFAMRLRYAMPHPKVKGLSRTAINKRPIPLTQPPNEISSIAFHHQLNGSGAVFINTNAMQSDA